MPCSHTQNFRFSELFATIIFRCIQWSLPGTCRTCPVSEIASETYVKPSASLSKSTVEKEENKKKTQLQGLLHYTQMQQDLSDNLIVCVLNLQLFKEKIRIKTRKYVLEWSVSHQSLIFVVESWNSYFWS